MKHARRSADVLDEVGLALGGESEVHAVDWGWSRSEESQ